MNAIFWNSQMRRWLFAALWLLMAGLMAYASGLRFNPTPSLPKGVYRIAPGQDLARGDFVSFCLHGEFGNLAKERDYLQAGSCENGLRPLLKRLAGLPGDYIDAASLTIRMADSQGRPMPSILASGVIPSGMALVLSEHEGSFDSRYFGLVPLESLQRVEPLFLFSEPERFANPLNGEQSPPTVWRRALFRSASHHQSSFTALNPKGE
ncbi:conjugative transfer signal peptidase TraF [Desulfovibrio sp. OttesenSCG-928-O18]|nr:conjugative transfer signal peptidase TraF [Desulfovibrio sp. OttesenSCG-928-O18]